jgi:hypothetical protein
MPLTLEDAKALLYRETVYHGRYTNSDGSPQVWRVTGKVKKWKRDPSRVYVPISRGMYEHHYINEDNLTDWHISEHEAALAHLSERDRVIVPLKCEFIDTLISAVNAYPMPGSDLHALDFFLSDFHALISGKISPEVAPLNAHVAELGALLNKHGESKFVRDVMDAFSRGKEIKKMVPRRYCDVHQE